MNKHGYSLLTLKSLDEETREFTGIASTPEPDRVNDIMNPKGAKFSLPMPFLWQHDSEKPIGEITEAKVTSRGIEVKGRIAKISDGPRQLVARLDEAWVSIREGLVRGLSIGFRGLKYSFLDSGGIEFDEWDWYELSAVTIPANAQGQITSVKQLKDYDADILAASGKKDKGSTLKTSSGVSDKKPIKIQLKENPMNLSEKLKAFQEELKAKKAKLVALAEKSGEDNQTFNEAEQEEFDTLTSETKELEGHIKRLEIAVSASAATATPVTKDAGASDVGASAARSGIVVKTPEKLEKGVGMARYAMCMLAAKGNPLMASELAKTHYPQQEGIAKALEFQAKGGSFESIMKATVNAGTTIDSTWAAPLVQYQNFAGDFIEYLRPQTILGQFGQGGIPALRSIPFNVHIQGQTSGGSASWVGEGKPKPLTKFDFNDVELRWAKVASIAVLTEELVRFSDPSAERLVRDALAAAVIERLDRDFVDPTKAASANVSPASITNGVTPINSTSSDAEGIRCDLQKLWAPFLAANNPPKSAVYIMDSVTALGLSMIMNPLGQPEFPGITMNGGTLGGVPVIVSDYLPVNSGGHIVILANASDIWLADDGQVTIDLSRETALQMLDNPTNASDNGTATSMVSMFQTNSVAFRAERYINWAKRRSSAVQYLSSVDWACAS